jgi:hypothetical protein
MPIRARDGRDAANGYALLLVDILGTKAVWAKDGRNGAAALFEELARLVRQEGDTLSDGIASGAVESDCAAIICETPSYAVRLGVGLYRRAFFDPKTAKKKRLWLRGVIVPIEGPADVRWLRQSEPLSEELAQIAVETYSGDLLDALSMEKAGFKGMRLLLDPALRTAAVRRDHKIDMGDGHRALYPFKHLEHSAYGERLENHLDVLWMATNDDEEWRRWRGRMSARMRYSARTPDEVLQAAATQVVFDECSAIRDSL